MNHLYCFGVIRTTQGSLYESYELRLAQLGHSYFWLPHMDLTSVGPAESVAGLGLSIIFCVAPVTKGRYMTFMMFSFHLFLLSVLGILRPLICIKSRL